MITDKQRQRDYEYEADYQSKSRYTTEQWTNILNSGQLDEKISPCSNRFILPLTMLQHFFSFLLRADAHRKTFYRS